MAAPHEINCGRAFLKSGNIPKRYHQGSIQQRMEMAVREGFACKICVQEENARQEAAAAAVERGRQALERGRQALEKEEKARQEAVSMAKAQAMGSYMCEGLNEPHWVQMLGSHPAQNAATTEEVRKQAVGKARQEAENRAKAAAHHALEMAQAQQLATQKILEEKAAAERLATERELADLFAPQPPPQQHKHTTLLMPSDAFRVPSPPVATAEYRAQDWMTKAQFRAMRQRAGFPLNADQHVCHIIAESNGGANHIDNYYVASASLNQSLGNRNDSYLAEAAGLEQSKKAVAVSRTKGYTGPGAEELIEMAKAARKSVSAGGGAAPSPPSGGAVYFDQVTPQQEKQLPAWHREALESQRRAAKEQYESTNFTRHQRILRGTW